MSFTLRPSALHLTSLVPFPYRSKGFSHNRTRCKVRGDLAQFVQTSWSQSHRHLSVGNGGACQKQAHLVSLLRYLQVVFLVVITAQYTLPWARPLLCSSPAHMWSTLIPTNPLDSWKKSIGAPVPKNPRTTSQIFCAAQADDGTEPINQTKGLGFEHALANLSNSRNKHYPPLNLGIPYLPSAFWSSAAPAKKPHRTSGYSDPELIQSWCKPGFMRTWSTKLSSVCHTHFLLPDQQCVCVCLSVCACVTLCSKESNDITPKRHCSAEHSGDCTQRSYPLVPEAGPDQSCVPAFVTTRLIFTRSQAVNKSVADSSPSRCTV